MPSTQTSLRPEASAGTDARWADLVEEMGLMWDEFGMQRMDGRVMGYLMLSNAPHVSSSELREALQASAGSISTSTRRLKEWGFIRQVAVAGERSHFFRADDDVWGSFLEHEHRGYIRARELAQRALALLGEADEHPRIRFQNMRDYHDWLEQDHNRLLTRWEEWKRERDGRSTTN
jgi:DNA-binding transcriptional regulator GbsR (MarR family)